jgi:thioredoxin 1
MLIVNDDNFEAEVLASEIPVLLEFYSDSCIPCKRMSPILAELDEENEGIKVAKINIRSGAERAKEYQVMASPTIVLFNKGAEVSRVRGVVKKAELEALIEGVQGK